jgi:hypothetical protein
VFCIGIPIGAGGAPPIGGCCGAFITGTGAGAGAAMMLIGWPCPEAFALSCSDAGTAAFRSAAKISNGLSLMFV